MYTVAKITYMRCHAVVPCTDGIRAGLLGPAALLRRAICQLAFVRALKSVLARCSYYCQTASDDAGSCGFGSQFADSEGATDGVAMPAWLASCMCCADVRSLFARVCGRGMYVPVILAICVSRKYPRVEVTYIINKHADESLAAGLLHSHA